jgi:uncharacterized protein (TIGR03492 family)
VKTKILFISNGHGEDLNGSQVFRALRDLEPELELAAMPIVGEGNAYRNLGAKIIGPTQALPSGGFIYMDRWKLVEDARSGLLTLLWRQIQAIREYSRDCTAIFATGDLVVLLLAYITGKPYTTFIVSTSAYYEGKMRLPIFTNLLLRSNRCQTVFTRDRFTAEDLHRQGISKAVFAGYPVMDVLRPTGKDLQLLPDLPLVALLPGSRLPESAANLQLLLDLAIATALEFGAGKIQFRLAVTPNLLAPDAQGVIALQQVATQRGWEYTTSGWLTHPRSQINILCTCDAFADILQQSDIVVGMAGTAIEQAVGLGKPVIQIPGAGPQFTYRFAEAQMRLLGLSVKTIGTTAATPENITQAARSIYQTLTDRVYLERCRENGLERVGVAGGAAAMARIFAQSLMSNRPINSANYSKGMRIK